MKKLMRGAARVAATFLCTGSLVVVLAAPATAIPVFDATNYTQNLLQAARALEQINHQVTSLQNEATMLQNMARNLERIDFPQLGRMTAALKGVDQLMGEARGIGFEIERIDERLQAMFPAEVSAALKGNQRVIAARSRLDSAREGYRHSMRVQSQVAANVQGDAELLRELVGRSQGASGALQVSQATNQLLALSTKQQLQLQQLIAAEFRSQSLERARRVQEQQEARAAAKRFLGSGQAYTRH